jgi:hypothetical protein
VYPAAFRGKNLNVNLMGNAPKELRLGSPVSWDWTASTEQGSTAALVVGFSR